MEIELRWYKYARAISPVLQFREKIGPRGEDWWGKWQDVPIVLESDSYGY